MAQHAEQRDLTHEVLLGRAWLGLGLGLGFGLGSGLLLGPGLGLGLGLGLGFELLGRAVVAVVGFEHLHGHRTPLEGGKEDVAEGAAPHKKRVDDLGPVRDGARRDGRGAGDGLRLGVPRPECTLGMP